MKKTKLIAFAMVLAVMASSIYAKPKKSTKSKATVAGTAKTAGWTLNTDKPIKFDWYINFSWFARHWGDSMVSKYIAE
jgi:putative aldouronate transport system substrate-binding protein